MVQVSLINLLEKMVGLADAMALGMVVQSGQAAPAGNAWIRVRGPVSLAKIGDQPMPLIFGAAGAVVGVSVVFWVVGSAVASGAPQAWRLRPKVKMPAAS